MQNDEKISISRVKLAVHQDKNFFGDKRIKSHNNGVEPKVALLVLSSQKESVGMTNSEMEFFKRQLLVKKAEVMNQLHNLVSDENCNPGIAGDEADRVAEELTQTMSWQLKERERALIQQIESALFRISKGTFGYCIECEDFLGTDRLAVRPMATMCVSCQEDKERGLY